MQQCRVWVGAPGRAGDQGQADAPQPHPARRAVALVPAAQATAAAGQPRAKSGSSGGAAGAPAAGRGGAAGRGPGGWPPHRAWPWRCRRSRSRCSRPRNTAGKRLGWVRVGVKAGLRRAWPWRCRRSRSRCSRPRRRADRSAASRRRSMLASRPSSSSATPRPAPPAAASASAAAASAAAAAPAERRPGIGSSMSAGSAALQGGT